MEGPGPGPRGDCCPRASRCSLRSVTVPRRRRTSPPCPPLPAKQRTRPPPVHRRSRRRHGRRRRTSWPQRRARLLTRSTATRKVSRALAQASAGSHHLWTQWWGGWHGLAVLNLTLSSHLVPKPGTGWGTEAPARGSWQEAGSWWHQAFCLSKQCRLHGVPGWGSSVVVCIPPRWSLGGPGPATARGGGYGTGHIRVSLLPLTAEQWKPLNPEEKKRYDREFLLGFQFIFASMQKPEGLPQITDVVLDKVGAALEIGGAWVVPRWGV